MKYRMPVSRHNHQRLGFTLVELLVLIAVLLTVTAVVIPSVRFVLKDRKIREAARVVDAFVVEAQTEAVSTGMGGIWIERDTNTPNTATRIYKIKSPPPYTGDFLGATCQITQAGPNPAEILNGVDDDGNMIVDDLYLGLVRFNMQTSSNSINLIRAGDLIQFDFKGPWYVIAATPTWAGGGNQFTNPVPFFSSAGPIPTVPGGGQPLNIRFKVFRMPQRSSSSYIDLPRTTMIDLSKSGLTVLDLDGNNIADDAQAQGSEFANLINPPSSVQVIFGEDGGLEMIIANGIARRPDRSVHILIASDDRESDADLDPANSTQTLENVSNSWLTITRQGAVSITPLADINTDPNFVGGFPGELLRSSRRNAREIETATGG